MTSTITTTVGALLNAEEPLGRLLALPLRVKAAYHLKRLAKLVVAELKTFYEMREGFIRDLGVGRGPTEHEAAAGAQETVYEVRPGSHNWAEFQRRMTELLAQPVTLPLGPLDAALLDGERISARDLELLDPLVQMGPDDSP